MLLFQYPVSMSCHRQYDSPKLDVVNYESLKLFQYSVSTHFPPKELIKTHRRCLWSKLDYILFASYHLDAHAIIYFSLAREYKNKRKWRISRLHNSQYKQEEKIKTEWCHARLALAASVIHFFADIAAMKFSIFVISSRLFVVDAALWMLSKDCMSLNSNASLAESSYSLWGT